MPKRRRSATWTQVQRLRLAVAAVSHAIDALAAELRAAEGRAPAKRRRPTRERAEARMSPKRRDALRLQGQYIGHLRHLAPRQQAKVKASRAKRGVEAAIRMAKRLGQR